MSGPPCEQYEEEYKLEDLDKEHIDDIVTELIKDTGINNVQKVYYFVNEEGDEFYVIELRNDFLMAYHPSKTRDWKITNDIREILTNVLNACKILSFTVTP